MTAGQSQPLTVKIKNIRNTFFMKDQSGLSANRRKSMQLFILNSLITEIKRGKKIDFSQIPADIVEMLREEAAKNQELRAALEQRSKN
jgi:hypothetical protein